MNQPIIFLSPCRRSIQFSRADHQTRLPPGSRSPAYDLARPDKTLFFGQTIKRDQLCQTRQDQLSFLPQTTQHGQHSLSVSLTLPQYTQPPPLGFHYQLFITGKVHSLCVGHGRLIYKAMDEPYKTYFPHTFGLKSLEVLFRLYLIVVRAASGAPWAGTGLPYPFTIIGLLCKYSVSDRSLAFEKQFRPRLGVSSSSRRFNFLVSPSSLSQSSMQSPAQLRQIRSISLSLFTFQSMCWASEAFTR